MEKSSRGRGRPRKNTASPNLVKKELNSSNEKVPPSCDDMPEFFKIYLHNLYSKTMRIPPDFIAKDGVNMSKRTWTLKRTPSGASWEVDTNTNTTDGSWFFEKGWPEFVRKNSLQEADFLTFCYVGDSTFSVTIFSPTGCPKRYDDDDAVDVDRGDGSDDDDVAADDDGDDQERNSRTSDDEASESEDSESKRVVTRPRPRRRPRASVDNSSTNPSFTSTMEKTYINFGHLNLPMPFWNAFMGKDEEKKGTNVSLWVQDESWSMKLVKYKGKVQLKGPKFFKDNSLEFGTSCTFQLINHASHFSFKVTINR